jgi:hypothetical protein
MSNSLGLNPEAVGNGSSTTVFVKTGRMVLQSD